MPELVEEDQIARLQLGPRDVPPEVPQSLCVVRKARPTCTGESPHNQARGVEPGRGAFLTPNIRRSKLGERCGRCSLADAPRCRGGSCWGTNRNGCCHRAECESQPI